MSKYDEYLAEVKASVKSAGEYIPKLCDELKKEGLDKESINDKVMKDCLAIGLARSTITHNMPEEYKDIGQVEAGKKGGRKKKEIVVTTDGSEASDGKGVSPETVNDDNEKPSRTFNEVTKDIPSPTKDRLDSINANPEDDDPEALKKKLAELLEINKFQANQIKKQKQAPTHDEDCSSHSMYLKSQAKLEQAKIDNAILQKRIDALDEIAFQPADKVPNPPDTFQVNKDADMMKEYFYSGIAPTKAIQNLRQILNSVTSIDIGWRVVE